MLIFERKKQFLLIALDNGINAGYAAEKENGLYKLKINCNKQHMVTYGVFDTLVQACKCYRKLKKRNFLTLNEKIKKNPEIKKLIGGGVFWIWNDNYDEVMYSEKDTDAVPDTGENLLCIADELYKRGIDRAMFGIFFEGDSHLTENLYKKYGYISTQYDNYNDVLNPELLDIVPNNRVKNCDYTARRMKDYPDGIQINKDGQYAGAWALKGFDGEYHSQNTLCPIVAADRMQEEIPRIIEKFPFYKGRFIDVYGGGVAECCSKEHPLTFGECIKVKNDAFKSLETMGLIAGTEDGFEDIIDSLVYTEGLHSPVYFRFRDCRRNHAHIHNKAQTEHITRYMMNPKCRVPLWQLVYHECMLSFPYWGDSTAATPEVTYKKVLFAVLYGCPPLYSFSVGNFSALKEDIVDSYKKLQRFTKKLQSLR